MTGSLKSSIPAMDTSSSSKCDYYNLIQCPVISSSSDQTPSSQQPVQFYPRRRVTYRSDPIIRHPRLLYSHNRALRRAMELQNHCDNNAYIGPSRKLSTRYSVVCLLVIFLTSVFILGSIYRSFPDLSPEEKQHIKIPWNLDDAKNLGAVLDKYKENHYYEVFFGVCMTYIFLQTFAIPGSLFLSVLSGFLFSFLQALALVCTCSALGASLCFLISQLVGRKLIQKYFPEKAASWGAIVNKHRDNLLNYVIFLRVTPFLPNWFINLTAPVIGVPLIPFALGTFIGVAPPSFIALQAGKTLHNMSATDSALSWTSLVLLMVFGVFSLIPIYFKDKLKTKFE